GPGVHIVLARIFGGGAMGGFKHGNGVAHVGAWRNADAADLGGQRVGNIVAVEVQGGNHAVFDRAQQDLLQEGVGDTVLDRDVLAGFRVFELHPEAAVDLGGAELLLRQAVGPV